MGLISKVSDKISGSSHKHEPATAHTQPGLDNRTGTSAGTGTTTAGQTGNYGVMDPSHQRAGHGTGTHDTSATHGTTSTQGTGLGSTTGTHGTTGVGSTSGTHATGDNRTTGEKVKDAVLPGSHKEKTRRKKHREPGYVRSGRSSSSSSSSSSDDEKRRHGTTTRGVTGSRDVDRQGGRLGELHLNERDLSSAKGEHTVKHAAPVVAEHVHDKYEHVDKTRVEELRQKTEVTQTVQPVYDEVKHGATRERVDHGLEVHEHGNRGLDRSAEAELARKREQIAKEHRSTHDEETRQTSLRPNVDVHQRTNVVEEVVPVIEKDIYRPHEIEHVKHEVHIHHDRPQVTGTTVAKPISVTEYERASGVKIHDVHSGGTRETLTTDKHMHGTHGDIGSRVGGSDSTSSYDSRSTTGTHGTSGTEHGDNRSMGQKIKDTVTGSSSSSSTTHTGSRDYDNTRSTGSGYDETQRGHGTGVGSTTGTHGTGSGVPHEPSLGVDQSTRQTTSGSTDRHTTGSNQDARPLMDRLS